jgi:hypothetical protein
MAQTDFFRKFELEFASGQEAQEFEDWWEYCGRSLWESRNRGFVGIHYTNMIECIPDTTPKKYPWGGPPANGNSH